MNFLITAGGTNEKIDDVRYITNYASGNLGKKIAEKCLSYPDINVYYVYGKNAVLPKYNDRLHLYPIESVNDLKNQLEILLESKKFFAVIHSMAVSDYYVENAFSLESLVQSIIESYNQSETNKLNEKLIEEAIDSINTNLDKKISSKDSKLFLELGKAPKVISLIKKWQPSTKLVGFKLLVDVSEKELINIAFKQLEDNRCDFVLANDLTKINDEQHLGLLINNKKSYKVFKTKREIAEGLVEELLKLN